MKSIGAYYLNGWKKTFVYKGTATRKEYWSFVIINLLIFLALSVAGLGFITPIDGYVAVMWFICLSFMLFTFYLLMFIAGLAVGVRRMHDIGKSGWWYSGPIIIPWLIGLFLSRTESHFHFIERYNWIVLIVLSLNLISLIVTVWLCCLPTKQKPQI